jgi:hypothetical protein
MSKYPLYRFGSCDLELESLADDDLVNEFALEFWADDRMINSDPPSRTADLRAELLRRLGERETQLCTSVQQGARPQL